MKKCGVLFCFDCLLFFISAHLACGSLLSVWRLLSSAFGRIFFFHFVFSVFYHPLRCMLGVQDRPYITYKISLLLNVFSLSFLPFIFLGCECKFSSRSSDIHLTFYSHFLNSRTGRNLTSKANEVYPIYVLGTTVLAECS